MRSILLFILIFLIFAISEAQENIDKNLDFIKPIGFGSREKRYGKSKLPDMLFLNINPTPPVKTVFILFKVKL